MASCEVKEKRTYEEDSLQPRDGGLNDLHMGTSDRRYRCKTCSGTLSECPGHFGYITLAEPVYHNGYLNVVQKILTCVCFACGKLRMRQVLKSLQEG